MNKLSFLFRKSLCHYAWQEFLVRYRFKYVLPRIDRTELDGIQLDLSKLSLKVRNRILMGIYEAHEKQMCHEFLKPDDTVLEIGGAIGFIGLVCQKKIGIRNYFVFEANPETLAILQENYRRNGLQPVAWNMALGPNDGMLELEVGSDFWENSVVKQAGTTARSKTVQVPGASLEGLLRRTGARVNVLIIDVEGAEQFIDLDEIPDSVEKIIIELHPHVLGPEKTYDLIAGLIHKGFYVAREEGGAFAFLKRGQPEHSWATGRWEQPEKGVALATRRNGLL
jgi:FkbM family methyltransferase